MLSLPAFALDECFRSLLGGACVVWPALSGGRHRWGALLNAHTLQVSLTQR